MQPSDFERFHGVMTGMSELYEREISDPLLDVYWLALRDWSLEDFESAAAHLMQTSKWFPKPSEFTDLSKASKPGPAEAWTLALSACKDWRVPELLPDGAVAKAAAAVGGFRAIAMTNVEHGLPHVQRRFLEAYAEISEREEVTEALPQLSDRSKLAPRINYGMKPLADVAAVLPIRNRQ